MVSITVPEKYNNKKLDRFLKDTYKNLPINAIYKALRTKDIKINGTRTNQNIVLTAGDRLDIYIKDEMLYGTSSNTHSKNTPLEIIFEDKHLLLINKKPGIPVQRDTDPNEASLEDLAAQYLKEKGEYTPGSFAPALCHRLDRNTGGIVILAKTPEALEVMLDKIKNREVKKYYQCLVIGCPVPAQAELKNYLFKDASKSLVKIYDTKKTGTVEIITRYKVLNCDKEMSTLEVELVTGKTHQIRAHLAYIGHPIVGDGKYGINKFNRKVGAKHQALWAYKVIFDFKDAGILNYLKGRTFQVDVNFGIKVK